MAENVRASVGIATHMRPDYVDSLLESIGDQTRLPAEVIVVDDSPSDRTRAVVDRHRGATFDGRATELRYDRMSPDGTNQQAAKNRIIKLATGDLLCFLDDDTVCVPEWLSTIVAAYRSNPGVVGVGGPALRTDEDLELCQDPVTEPAARNAVNEFGEVVDASGQWVPAEPTKTDILRGANMAIETDALRAVGGFDTGYGGPAIFEEWDLTVRVARECGDLLYHPDASVYHIEAPSGGSRAEDKSDLPGTYWYARNSLRFRKKLFADTYHRSLSRLFLRGTDSGISPIWRRLLGVITLDTAEYYWLKGYVDGIVEGSGGTHAADSA